MVQSLKYCIKSKLFWIYVLLAFAAFSKQLIKESLLLDSLEYLKKSQNLLNNWHAENVPQERYLEPFRRTIGYPFILKVLNNTHFLVYVFQLIVSLFIPILLHQLSKKHAFFSTQWNWMMLSMLTYPLQFFYTSFLMPEILVQACLLLMIVFYFEGQRRWVPFILTVLVLLKPVFVIFLIIPLVLAILNHYQLSVYDLLPITVIFIVSVMHYKQYGVFEYSSVGYTNAYDYNRKKFLIQKIGETNTEFLYNEENSVLMTHAKEDGYLVHFFKEKTTPILLDPIYWQIHLKGFIVTFLDPGRYDAMVFLNWEKTSGFMGLNDGNAIIDRPWYQWLYITIFAIFAVAKLMFALFAVFHWRKHSVFVMLAILALILAFMAGPVGSARYLMPVYPLMSILSAIGLLTVKNQFLR